jgi:hypothetical protein
VSSSACCRRDTQSSRRRPGQVGCRYRVGHTAPRRGRLACPCILREIMSPLNNVAAILALVCLAGCGEGNPTSTRSDAAPRSAADQATQQRENDFRWKERCAASADRFDRLFAPTESTRRQNFDVSVTEVFYSPTRNSCVCEVTSSGPTGRGGGSQSVVTLYDCLTREDLGDTLIDLNADYQQGQRTQELWNRRKEELKANPVSNNK